MKTRPQETGDKFTFTKENFSGKLYFLCKESCIRFTFKIILTGYNPFFYVFAL